MVDAANGQESEDKKKRVNFNQTDFPQFSLEAVLSIPKTICEHYAGHPTRPIDIAAALNRSPSSSDWRYITGAAAAYALTNGGYKVEQISITTLGKRIVAPTESGDDVSAKREAVMKPRIMKAFYERYNNAKFPDDNIAGNVLVSLGLPRERVQGAVRILRENAQQAQILKQVAGANYIDLNGSVPLNNTASNSPTTSSIENSERPASPNNDVPPSTEVREFTKPTNSFGSPSLHIDLQIHISSDASFEQIDKIFESIAKHLYQRSNDE
ncbi:hypothetical protein [Phormidesmis priestleyi]